MKTILDLLQLKLKMIRLYLGLSAQEFANYLGVTRQTVNNLEIGKTPLNPTQVTALLAIIDRRVPRESSDYEVIRNLIVEHTEFSDSSPFSNTKPLLTSWLDYLGVAPKKCDTALYTDLTEALVFVFYDFLMEENSIEALRELTPYMLKNSTHLIMPRTHAQKLVSVASKEEGSPKALHTKKVMDQLIQLKSDNLFQIRGNENDSFADDNQLINHIVSRYGDDFSISILKQNSSELFLDPDVAKCCSFYRLNSHGTLERYTYSNPASSFQALLLNATDDDI